MKTPINEIIDDVYETIKDKQFHTAYPEAQRKLGQYTAKYSKELVIDALLQLSLILAERLHHCDKKSKEV